MRELFERLYAEAIRGHTSVHARPFYYALGPFLIRRAISKAFPYTDDILLSKSFAVICQSVCRDVRRGLLLRISYANSQKTVLSVFKGYTPMYYYLETPLRFN